MFIENMKVLTHNVIENIDTFLEEASPSGAAPSETKPQKEESKGESQQIS